VDDAAIAARPEAFAMLLDLAASGHCTALAPWAVATDVVNTCSLAESHFVAGDGDVSRARRSGNEHTMTKLRYALLGWLVWKFAKRRARRKLRLS
jgi:hypothetical protein